MSEKSPPAPSSTMDLATKTRFFSRDACLLALLFSAVICGILLRTVGAATYDLFGDDYFTFRNALENPLGRGIFSGYFLLTRASLFAIGENILGVRLPSLIFGVLAVPVFYWRMKVNFGKAAAVLGLAVFAFSGWHVEMTYEARYYSGLFLFGMLCVSYFLEFLRDARLLHLGLSLTTGIVACLFHFTAALLFAVIGLYCVVALLVSDLLPNPKTRRPISYLVGVMLLGGLAAIPIIILPMLDKWGGMAHWGVAGWAIVPLMAFNHLSLPVFFAMCSGIVALWFQPGKRPEWFLLTITIVVALLSPTILGMFMNMSPRYIFVLVPLFFASAGVFCADLFDRLADRDIVVAVTPCLLLIAASLPGVVSHHLEKRRMSETEISRLIVEQAETGDIMVGNFGSPLVDFSKLDKRPSPAAPLDRSFDWETYLDNNFRNNDRTVWIALEVSRSGLAPELQRWLIANTEWILEQRSGRIDRRERVFFLWRKPPLSDADETVDPVN